MTAGNVNIICVPYNYLSLPSLDMAVLKACLTQKGIDSKVHHMDIAYALHIGGDTYLDLRDSLLGDAIFSAILFPDNQDRVKAALSKSGVEDGLLDDLVKKTENFLEDYLESKSFEFAPNSVAIFHLYSAQLFPALCISKKIYERFGTRVWFSGYHCQGACGDSLREIFPHIEKTFGTNIHRSIVSALEQCSLAGYVGTIDDMPTPDYSDFFEVFESLPRKFKSAHIDHYWLQLEFSRGCWWDACSFCTLNCQHEQFENRNLEKIIEDYKTLASKHGTVQILANEFNTVHGWKDYVSRLNEELPGMKGSFDLCFKVSELQNEKDAAFLGENDINILVGVESLSKDELKLLNKGCSVIEAIQMLKYMEPHGVKCFYNLMHSLPFETDQDLVETERVIKFIIHLRPPFDVETFRLTYGSSIFKNPECFSVSTMGMRENVEGVLLPQSVHSQYVPFFMDFTTEKHSHSDTVQEWENLIGKWSDAYYAFAKQRRPKKTSLLHMRSIGDILEICDARYGDYRVQSLSGNEKCLYEFCDKIRTFEDIKKEFSDINSEELMSMLKSFINDKTMFEEDASYLSLAI